MTAVAERLREFMRRWKHPAAVFLIGVVTLGVFGAGSIVSAVISDQLVAGPDFAVSVSPLDDGSTGVTKFTPTSLGDSALRIGWALGSAAILLALAIVLLTMAQVGVRESKHPFFGEETKVFIIKRGFVALILIAAGGILRRILEDRIADALSLEVVDFSDEDFALWIFDVPGLAVFAGILVVAAVWGRAQSLHAELEDVV